MNLSQLDKIGASNEQPQSILCSIPEAIAEAKAGRMVIFVDDENRENEGDLVIPADLATAEAITFMARNGCGLVCMPILPARARSLDLSLMPRRNMPDNMCAFTLSVEAVSGVTTGISAADRARTVEVMMDPETGPDGIATPGHLFPLIAKEGGVLERAGHTEAAIDLAVLAGCRPGAVICEVMNEDGTMARLPDLVKFADANGLKIASIAALIEYREQLEIDKNFAMAAG